MTEEIANGGRCEKPARARADRAAGAGACMDPQRALARPRRARRVAGHGARRGLPAVRRAWPLVSRRSRRALRRQCRPWPRRNRRGDGEAGARARLCLVRQLHQLGGSTARRCACRADAGRSRPVLLLLRRLGSDRKCDEDRQAGAGDARLPQALQGDCPARRLPRRDLWRDEHYLLAQREVLRPVYVRREFRAVAKPLPQRFRDRGGGRRSALRRGDRTGDPGAGSGYGGGGDRRAGLGVQLKSRPLTAILAAGPADLRHAWRPADHGRGDQRVRAHRQDVRVPSISASCRI